MYQGSSRVTFADLGIDRGIRNGFPIGLWIACIRFATNGILQFARQGAFQPIQRAIRAVDDLHRDSGLDVRRRAAQAHCLASAA
jgi:hypothetical protein